MSVGLLSLGPLRGLVGGGLFGGLFEWVGEWGVSWGGPGFQGYIIGGGRHWGVSLGGV